MFQLHDSAFHQLNIEEDSAIHEMKIENFPPEQEHKNEEPVEAAHTKPD